MDETMNGDLERIEMALSMMATAGPRDLRAYLRQPGPDFAKVGQAQVDGMIDLLLSHDPNHPARLRFSDLLRSWDNEPDAKWAKGIARNSATRRDTIHSLLHSGPVLQKRIDALLPFYQLEEPLVIAEEHEEWYKPRAGVRDYYWRTYLSYLKDKRKWDDVSLLTMKNSTRAIVECLANPESPKAYASRGLVMGYVQSGKTANFTGVVARAADAGYRLIIVLAGTWNILRNQTQRRFDKDLLGKELLSNDEAYTAHPPADWNEFLEHGRDPVALGQYTWQRLTRPDIDFRRLKAAIDNLEFEKVNKALPIYDPSNLHSLPVKLLVVKKHSIILANLVKDLKLLRTGIAHIPTLIVDDESDQAGLNTVDPRKIPEGTLKRSETNRRIVDLLALFPRGQYVGYTATPYANALVDADDLEDLFPRDYIISMERPRGYMGVSNFFDPAIEYQDLSKDDYSQAEIAHIRRVESTLGADDEDLKSALRSYVLSGGLKLYRVDRDPRRYRSEYFKHHTMLVHTSSRMGEHVTVAGRIEALWDRCAFNTPQGLSDLETLWIKDYSKVCAAKGNEIVPESISQLVPYLSEAIRRIENGPKVYQIVNSESSEAPDFSAAPVWKIVIGGNKLSRGYTIEGLTVSYYRRVAGTADTLMQMGRWFGFRPGYHDLVRVFLGVKEGRRGDIDLVSLFKEVCRMEERFRDELRRYIRRPGVKPITPRDIPPLISAAGNLPPTARNKMFNSVLANKNFGGQRSMLTLTAASDEGMVNNVEVFKALVSASRSRGAMHLGGTSTGGEKCETTAVVLETSNARIIAFLKAYQWLESEYKHEKRPADASLQIEFLENQKHGIDSWLIMAPQRRVSFGPSLRLNSGQELTVKERHRNSGRGFQVFGEPVHRTIAEYLAGIEEGSSQLAADQQTNSLRNDHRGVFLAYPVRETEKGPISIGFELVFPKNDLPFDINFTVRRKGEMGKVVVTK